MGSCQPGEGSVLGESAGAEGGISPEGLGGGRLIPRGGYNSGGAVWVCKRLVHSMGSGHLLDFRKSENQCIEAAGMSTVPAARRPED